MLKKEFENKLLDMLYNKDIVEVTKEINRINDLETLYTYAYNYNWDNGFKIPRQILSKKSCDLSTALMLFYKADGFVYLCDKSSVDDNSSQWSKFITNLYNKIINNEYKKSTIKFVPPLNKVQLYKLRKCLQPNEMLFIESFGSEDLDINL